MDIASEIKKNLISRIKVSEDLNFLMALQTIFDSSERSLYQLSEEQQAQIEIGRAEIEHGEFYENQQTLSEMKEWLTKK